MYQNYPYYNDNNFQNYQMNNPYNKQNSIPQGLKGRPVTSFDEARAAQIDLDGSLFIFPDLSNNKIYTKQLSMDGTAPLKIYELVEQPIQIQSEYVTREELNNAMNQLMQRMAEAPKEQNKPAVKNNF